VTIPLLAKAGLAGALVAGTVAGLTSMSADARDGFSVVNVSSANPRSGIENNVLTPSATETSVAWGNLPLANPDTANGVTHYGYDTANGGPLTQDPHEAFKTEPDKNVYLTFGGHHYLYQGHEGGPRGYVTRIDLDQADPAKRVTLISDVDTEGKPFPIIDGITWDPFSHELLLSAEAKAPTGGSSASSSTTTVTRWTARRSASTRWAPAATRACRTTRTATSGRSRTSAVLRPAAARSPTATSTASSPPTRRT
jgi:hypothetical protein